MIDPSIGGATSATVKVEDTGLAAISLSSRIPEFWTDQPRAWFIQLEATLAPQKLSDHAKYDLVVSKVSKDVILQITDILIKPPEEGKFACLKSRLLSIFEESESRQIQKLIGEMELGDQRPSQLLRRMRDLARGKINDDTLTVLWQNLLPTPIRGVLAVIETKDLDKLATVADKVLENSRSGQILEVSPQPPPSLASSSNNKLEEEITKLTQRIARLERGRSLFRQKGNFRRFSRSRSRGQQRDSKNPLCYYHRNYKEKAHKCVPPCSWKSRPDPAQEN